VGGELAAGLRGGGGSLRTPAFFLHCKVYQEVMIALHANRMLRGGASVAISDSM
jgi:hypothetical protein